MGDRLRAVRGETSQADFAAELGVHKNSVGFYERGKVEPSASFLVRLAQCRPVDLHWLLTGHRRSAAPAATADPALVTVPRYSVTASAGAGAANDQEEIIDHIAFSRDYLRRSHENLALIEVTGESMSPTISHGDLILIDRTAPLRDGFIYVIAADGDLLCKRILKLATGGIILKSDNPAYPDHQLPPDQARTLNILGQVIWHARHL